MTHRTIGRNEKVRKLQRTGQDGGSYTVTIPREFITQLAWQKGQKVVVSKAGDTLIIQDWEA